MHLSGRMPIHNIITPKKLEGPIGDLAGKKYVNMMFFHMGSQPNLAKLNARIWGKSVQKTIQDLCIDVND